MARFMKSSGCYAVLLGCVFVALIPFLAVREGTRGPTVRATAFTSEPIRIDSPPLRLMAANNDPRLVQELKDIIRQIGDLNIDVIESSSRFLSCGDGNPCLDGSLFTMPEVKESELVYATREVRKSAWESLVSNQFMESSDILTADAVVCTYPVSLCEVYMPLGLPMIWWVDGRFELGREEAVETELPGFLKNMATLARRNDSFILTTNAYDQQYIRFFTGLLPTVVAPAFARVPIHYFWKPGGSLIIPVIGYRLARARGSTMSLEDFLQPIHQALQAKGVPYQFVNAEKLYPDLREYPEFLMAHPAVLILPTDAADLNFYKYYRAGLPMIVPTVAAMAEFHTVLGMLSDRTWQFKKGRGVLRKSSLPPHPSVDYPFDPADDANEQAVQFWMQNAVYYSRPHVIQFDTFDELADKLSGADFNAISQEMRLVSDIVAANSISFWEELLRSLPNRNKESLPKVSFEQRMDALYGKDAWA